MIKTEVEDTVLIKLEKKMTALAIDLASGKISEEAYYILIRRVNSKILARRMFLVKNGVI